MANDNDQMERDDVNFYEMPNTDSEVLKLKHMQIKLRLFSLKICYPHPNTVYLQPTDAAQAPRPKQSTPVAKSQPKPKPPEKPKPPKPKPPAKQTHRISIEELSKVKLNKSTSLGNGQPSTITQTFKTSKRGFKKCPNCSTLTIFILLLTIIGWIVYTEIKNHLRDYNFKSIQNDFNATKNYLNFLEGLIKNRQN